MTRIFIAAVFILIPVSIFGGDRNEDDTLKIRPIGLDYSKYSGTNKLFMVGECEGMTGNQIVIFQNRPSFDFFEDDETYKDEQKELEQAIWKLILDQDADPMVIKGRWHEYQDRTVFLCHQILRINKSEQLTQ